MNECEDLFKLVHLLEIFDLESQKSLVDNFYCVMEKNEKWEWDIIAIFKYYDSLYKNPNENSPVCECPICTTQDENTRRENIENVKKIVYIMEFLETITDILIVDNVKEFFESGESDYMIRVIEEYFSFLEEMKVEDKNGWKHPNFYWKKLFDIPRSVYRAGVPREIYFYRKNTYFDDLIAGNPLASNGWLYESLIEMQKLDSTFIF